MVKKVIVILTILLTPMIWASSVSMAPLNKKGLYDFLRHIQYMPPMEVGFAPAEAKIISKGKNKSSFLDANNNTYQVYDVDLNNDSKREYVIVYLDSGSMRTSGVLKVLSQEQNKVIQAKDFEIKKIISKNLWKDESGDMSKFHLFVANPFIIKRKGKIVMRFLDTKPNRKVTEYTWSNKEFKKL
jgi:hypothetical protein